MDLFRNEPLPIATVRRTCDACGRVLELIARCVQDVERLDYNLALLSERHAVAHDAVEAGEKPNMTTASWKGSKAP